MATYTSTLPKNIYEQLKNTSVKLKIPINKIIEKALTLYLDHIKRGEYIKSYKEAANDKSAMDIAAEGMADYLRQIEE